MKSALAKERRFAGRALIQNEAHQSCFMGVSASTGLLSTAQVSTTDEEWDVYFQKLEKNLKRARPKRNTPRPQP